MGRRPPITQHEDGDYEVDTSCDFILGVDLTVFSKCQTTLCVKVLGRFLGGEVS